MVEVSCYLSVIEKARGDRVPHILHRSKNAVAQCLPVVIILNSGVKKLTAEVGGWPFIYQVRWTSLCHEIRSELLNWEACTARRSGKEVRGRQVSQCESVDQLYHHTGSLGRL